jgi:acyl carrier protein
MTPKTMDSLETVEAVMFIEEVLGTEIPDSDEEIGGPREMADWLETSPFEPTTHQRGRLGA